MRRLGVFVLVLALALGVGATGVPGRAMSMAVGWMLDGGTLILEAPVEEAVREAM